MPSCASGPRKWWRSSCRAEARARDAGEDRQALDYWLGHPERFTDAWLRSASLPERERHGELYNQFLAFFDVPGYVELAAQLAGSLTEETCFRWMSAAGCAPVAVLWHGLGLQRATALPGRKGNLFVKGSEVATAMSQVDRAMSGISMDEVIRKGDELGGSRSRIEEVRNIVTHLPDGLRRANESGMGFFAIARPQL
jgi:hypothetical protein